MRISAWRGSDVDLAISASIDYDGTFLTASFPRKQAIDAVSALFMATSLTGEFDNSSDIGAATDWVLTFPTKQFYVGGTPVGIDNRPFDKAFEARARRRFAGDQRLSRVCPRRL